MWCRQWSLIPHKDFVTKVAEGRNAEYDDIHKVAQGRIWSGIDGKENGLWQQLYKDGQPKLKVKFKNGIKNGEEYYWNSDGTVRYKDIYINGKIKKK